MNIRVMGSKDLVKRLSVFMRNNGLHDGRVYDNRGGVEGRVYINMDDREFDYLLAQLEGSEIKRLGY